MCKKLYFWYTTKHISTSYSAVFWTIIEIMQTPAIILSDLSNYHLAAALSAQSREFLDFCDESREYGPCT